MNHSFSNALCNTTFMVPVFYYTFITFQAVVERRSDVMVPRGLGLGYQGSVTLHAQTDRGAYCPGEEILISGWEPFS